MVSKISKYLHRGDISADTENLIRTLPNNPEYNALTSSDERASWLRKQKGYTNHVGKYFKDDTYVEKTFENYKDGYMAQAIKTTSVWTKAMNAFAISIKAVGSAFANIAISFVAFKAIEIGLAAIDNYVHRLDKLVEKGKEAQTSIKEINDSYTSKKTSAEELMKRYTELSSGVGIRRENNKDVGYTNFSLTNDEFTEFLSISGQLGELFPQLVSGFDAQGNSILNLSTNADSATKSLEYLLEQERILANYKISENLHDVAAGIMAENQKLQNEIDNSEKTYGATLSDKNGKKTITIDSENPFDFNGMQSALREAKIELIPEVDDTKYIYNLSKLTNEELGRFSEAYEEITGSSLTSLITRSVDTMARNNMNEAKIKANFKNLIPSLQAYMNTVGEYLNFSDNPEINSKVTEGINGLIGSIDYSDLSESDIQAIGTDVTGWITDRFLSGIESIQNRNTRNEISEAYAKLFSLDSSELTFSEYNKATTEQLGIIRENFIKDLGSIKGVEEYKKFIDNYGFSSSNSLISASDFARLQTLTLDPKIQKKLRQATVEQLITIQTKYEEDPNSNFDNIVNRVILDAQNRSKKELKFSDLFPIEEDEEATFTERIDTFQSSLSSLQTALDQLKTDGKFEGTALADLKQQFPDLISNTDNLKESISDLSASEIMKFSKEYKDAIAEITDEQQLADASAMFQDIIKETDLSGISMDKFEKALYEYAFRTASSTSIDDMNAASSAYSELMSKYSQTSKDREILFKIIADPTMVDATLEEIQTKFEQLSLITASEMKEVVASATAAASSIGTALTESGSLGGVTSDTMASVVSYFSELENINPGAAFTETSKGIEANVDSLRALSTAQYELRMKDFENSIRAQKTAMDGMKEGTDSYKNALAELISMQQSQAQYYAAFKQQMESLSDYNQWQLAEQTTNEGSKYDTILAGLETYKEAYDKNLVGTDEFKKFAALLSPVGSGGYENFMSNHTKASRYIKEDALAGAKNFLNDLKKFDLAQEIDGGWTTSFDNFEEVAQKLGVGVEIVEASFNKMKDIGADFNFVTDPVQGQLEIEDTATLILEEQARLRELRRLQSEHPDIDYTGDIEEATANIEAYSQTIRDTANNTSDAMMEQSDAFDEYIREVVNKIVDAQKEIDRIKNDSSMDAEEKELAINAFETAQRHYASESGITVGGALEASGYTTPQPLPQRAYADTTDTAAYASAIEQVTKAYDENDESVKQLIETIAQLDEAQLDSIVLDDGKYDSQYREQEEAIDMLINKFGIAKDKAKIMYDAILDYKNSGGSLIDTGLTEEEIEELTTKVPEKLQEMKDAGTFETDIDFSANIEEMSVDELQTRIDELNELKASVDIETDPETVKAIEDEIERTEMTKAVKVAVEGGSTTLGELAGMNAEELTKTLGITVDEEDVETAKAIIATIIPEEQVVPVKVELADEQFNTLVGSQDGGTVPVETSVNSEEFNALKESVDGYTSAAHKVSVVAKTQGQTAVESLGAAIQNVNDKFINVGVNVGNGISVLRELYQALLRIRSKEITVTTRYVQSGSPNVVNGTYMPYIQQYTGTMTSAAYANGTVKDGDLDKVLGDAFAEGTVKDSGSAYNVLNMTPAHAEGDVALPRNEKALVNELGQESLIRGGKWYLIPGKMHLENLKKGDIILNHKQTSDLLKHGKTDSHARAFASGTLGASTANAYVNPEKKQEGTFIIPETSSGKTNTPTTGDTGGKDTKKNTDSTEKNTQALDWVATALQVAARATEKLSKRITEYISFAKKKKLVEQQIDSVGNEINVNIQARDEYLKKANTYAGDIGKDYVKKVKEGTMNIEEIDTSTDSGKALAENIQKYQEYYEKALACNDAVQELINTQYELYDQFFSIPAEEAAAAIDKLAAAYENLDSILGVADLGETALSELADIIGKDTGITEAQKQATSTKATAKKSWNTYKKAKNTRKEAGESLNEELANSASKKTQTRVAKAVKDGTKVDTKGLKGRDLRAAQKYNSSVTAEANANDKWKTNKKNYQDASKALAEAKKNASAEQNIILDNQDSRSYVTQNKILDQQVKNKKRQNKETREAFYDAKENVSNQQGKVDEAKKKTETAQKTLLKTSGLSDKQKEQVKKGKEIDTSKLTGKALEKANAYNKALREQYTETKALQIAQEKLTEAQNAMIQSEAELAALIVENSKQKFENINDWYESKNQLNTDASNLTAAKNERKEARGQRLTKEDLEAERNAKRQERAGLVEQKKALEHRLKNSGIEVGSKEWNELQSRINQLGIDIVGLDTEIITLGKDIKDLDITNLEKDSEVANSESSYEQSELDLKDAKGQFATAQDYQDVINANNKRAGIQKQISDKEYARYEEELAAGNTDAANEHLQNYYASKIEENNIARENIELQKKMQSMEIERLDAQMQIVDATEALLTSALNLLEAQGKYASALDYTKLANIAQTAYNTYTSQGGEYRRLAKEERDAGNDKAALEMEAAAMTADANANNALADMYNYTKKMKELKLEEFQRQKEAYSAAQQYFAALVNLKSAKGYYLDQSDYDQQLDNLANTMAKQSAVNEEYKRLGAEARAEGRYADADAYDLAAANGATELVNLSIEAVKLAKEAREIELKRLNDQLGLADATLKYAQSLAALKEAQGYDLSSADYNEQKAAINNQIAIQDGINAENLKLAEQAKAEGRKADEVAYRTAYINGMATSADLMRTSVELTKELKNLTRTILEKQLELLDAQKSAIDSQISLYEAEGKYLTGKNYQDQLDINTKRARQQMAINEENKRLAQQAAAENREADERAYMTEYYQGVANLNSIYAENAQIQKEMNDIALKRLEIEKQLLDAERQIYESERSLKESRGQYLDQGDYLGQRGEIDLAIANQAEMNTKNLQRAIEERGKGNDAAADEYMLEYKNGLAELNSLKQEGIELDKAMQNIALERLQAELDILEANKAVVESLVSLKETQGKALDGTDYAKQIEENNKIINNKLSTNAKNYELSQKERLAGNDKAADEYWIAYQQGLADVNGLLADNVELNRQMKDIVISRTEKQLELLKANQQLVKSLIDLKEAEGKYLDVSDYQKQIRENDAQIEQLRIQSTEALNRYNEEMAANNTEIAQEYMQRHLDAQTDINGALAENAQLQKEIQDIVIRRLEREQELLEAQVGVAKSLIELKEAQGIDLEESDYLSQIADNNELIAKQREINDENLRNYNKALAEKNDAYADEYMKAYLQGQSAINGMLKENEELQDTLRNDVLYKYFTKALEKAEQLRNALSAINDLIDDEMKFDDDGNMTEFGFASVALNVRQYESDLSSIETLLQKREQMIADYNDGFNNKGYSKNEFDEDMQQITSDILSLLGDANSTRKAIVEMVIKQSEEELNKINELIEARQELLNKQKEYYDYDKTLKSKTKDLQLLEQQIRALDGVADAETKAKKARLEAQRAELQEELDDTVKEHQIDLKIEGLDELKNTLQENYDDYVKDLNQNLDVIVTTIKEATENVNGCLEGVNETIAKLLHSFGVAGLNTTVVGIDGAYASGTKNNAKAGNYLTQEDGLELIVTKAGLITPLSKGDGVVPADLTARLFEMANNQEMIKPQMIIPDMKSVTPIAPSAINITYGNLLNVQGDVNRDALPDLKTILEKSYKYTANEIRKDLRRNGSK